MSDESAFGSSAHKLDEFSHFLNGQSAALGVYGSPKAADKLYTNSRNGEFVSDGLTTAARSSTLCGPYYLSDAGRIQFYKHDKPTEFYGKEACLVRNETVRGLFVVRVPAGTPFNLIFRYKDVFEERRAAVERQKAYKKGGPYLSEREVGVNCGHATIVQIQDPPVLPIDDGLVYHGTPIFVQNNNGKGNIWVPFACDKTEFPAMIKRIRGYLETSVDGEMFGLVGGGNVNGAGGQDGFIDDDHPLYGYGFHLLVVFNTVLTRENSVREYPRSLLVTRLLGENSGGYGRGFTSSLVLDGEDNGAHSGDVRTAIQFEPTPRIPPCFDDGVGHYSTPNGFIVERPLVIDNVRRVCPTNVDLPPRHLDKKTNALYKTEMCRNWNEVGDCRYGRSCQFAHGQKELRAVPRHGQWKTKTCLAWLHGGCTYGSRCCYAHEVIPDNDTKGEPSNEQEPRGSPGSSGDSQPGFNDFFGSRRRTLASKPRLWSGFA
ncbi:unnamed protein product [Tuber aestivum]|uniref:C3H1-type domain-containing protein n=1 Tax=Tuber aestivum TaxID=59557 RepID=A0A292PZP5_9PEZI|nr:unnamed protein product [Tuber aestivum]